MPGIPKKGLRHSQLSYKTAGSAVADGSHQTYRVTFIEDGVEKKAFLKKLDKTLASKGYYPELLAKISVAVSLFKQMFQGKRSAEERLVFDENDEVMGTLSIDVEGFKPFNFSNELVPSDPVEKEKVIPSTKTLILHNIMELLVGRWFLDDDDGHPHNLSLAGDIDFDMFLYWFTVLIKKARFGIGVPKERVNLSVRDYETLAIVSDSKPYHWPAHLHSGEKTVPGILPGALLARVLPKQYAAPQNFRQLASEPQAHDQKFAAVLKILLTYQPEMMRKRLEELFGNMTLNYTSLDKSLYTEYQEKYKRFCNEKTNVAPFVDFIMGIYQEHYDNLYRVVVFYKGTKNNGYGVPLKPTHETLYFHPSFYRNIEAWVTKQNESVYSKDQAGLKFNLSDLQKRYHQIWRDAHTPTLRDILSGCLGVTSFVLNKLTPATTEKVEVTAKGKDVTDDTLTKAVDFIGAIPEFAATRESLIKQGIAPENKYLKSYELLKEFITKFGAIVNTYYKIDREHLTEADNKKFADGLDELLKAYDVSIRANLMQTSTPGVEFHTISEKLSTYIKHVNFARHLTTSDEQMNVSVKLSHPEETLPPTDPRVIKQYAEHLFEWAKGLKPDILNEHICDILDKHYTPTLAAISSRQRTEPVKKFLKTSVNDDGANRLAYIFASAHGQGGALNTKLIKYLTPIMLQTFPMPGIDAARKQGTFDDKVLAKYALEVESYAKTSKQITHLFSATGATLFYKSMYDWIDSLEKAKFDKVLDAALKDYKGSKYTLFGGKDRRKEVQAHPTCLTQAERVAKIFIDGDENSSLNKHLFQRIVAGIQAEISKDEAKEKAKMQAKEKPKELSKEQLLGRNLIKQYDHSIHTFMYEQKQSIAITLFQVQIDKKISGTAVAVAAAC